LLAETTSSLQVLDMPLVEIDDEDMRVLFNLATRCHTLRICESMKIDQTLPFLEATVRPRLQGRLHCRYHCRCHCPLLYVIGSAQGKRLRICARFGLGNKISGHSLANVEMTSVHRMKKFT
jgi:hypothetical protein